MHMTSQSSVRIGRAYHAALQKADRQACLWSHSHSRFSALLVNVSVSRRTITEGGCSNRERKLQLSSKSDGDVNEKDVTPVH